MFTGIVSDIGEVMELERNTAGARMVVACRYPAETILLGASICCAGICLTIVDRRTLSGGRACFTVEASAETLGKTTLGRWRRGTRINLERALKAGDELGGHIVSGHVDATAEIFEITPDGASKRFTFRYALELAPFIAPKGSICLDGTALTVNEAGSETFGVNMIPHTLKSTTWDSAREGDLVNLEIDMLVRYLARLREFQWKS
jgi:riboflavin synthase